MKKLVSLIVGLLVVASLVLVGCGSPSSATPSPAPAPAPAPGVERKEGKE